MALPETGKTPTPTRDEFSAQHEAGHCVVAHALGTHVIRVSIEPPQPHCHSEDIDPTWSRPGDPPLLEVCRRGGAVANAGAVAQMLIHRVTTSRSSSDMVRYRYYEQLSPESADQFFRACTTLAMDTLEAHRPAFWAIVNALLEKRSLERSEILALWELAV